MVNFRSIFIRKRTITTDIIQGIVVGAVLGFILVIILINAEVNAIQTTVNGWSTTMQCDEPGNGILLRAACAQILPAPAGKFILWLRAYEPGQAILNGEYKVPPVVEVNSS